MSKHPYEVMHEQTGFIVKHFGGTAITTRGGHIHLKGGETVTTIRNAMKPAELYEAVRVLWELDAGFRPRGLDYWETGEWDLCQIDDMGVDRAVSDRVSTFHAAALIRDRIVERLDELGCGVEQIPAPVPMPGQERMVVTRSRRTGEAWNSYGPDRTAALIEAAMKAVEPGKDKP